MKSDGNRCKGRTYLVIKRIFDLIIGIIGIIIMAVVGIIVKIKYVREGDRASIIYKQKRLGKDGKVFEMYKFRTMVPKAKEELEKILREDKNLAIEYERYKKLKEDPRITKTGQMLRKRSLDELPQFINVVKGEMGIIGKRY